MSVGVGMWADLFRLITNMLPLETASPLWFVFQEAGNSTQGKSGPNYPGSGKEVCTKVTEKEKRKIVEE